MVFMKVKEVQNFKKLTKTKLKNKKMSQLSSIRSNTNFALNYESGELIPQIEVIILVGYPEYKFKGDEIIKDDSLKEFRFNTSIKGLNLLIEQLQIAAENLKKIDQMAESLNHIIKANQK